MNEKITAIRDAVDEFSDSAQGRALTLRLNLAELALVRMKERGWTHRELALKCGWKESFLEEVLHSHVNWTSEEAGRLLYALGIDDVKLLVAG